MLTPEQIAAANKANLDALVELTRKSFENIEKLVALNLQAVRASMGDSADQAKALLEVKHPQELLSLQAGLIQPVADKATAYSRQVYDLATNAQSEVTKVVEAQMAAAQAQILALVDATVKNAPVGGESSAALVKQAVTAANSALESVQKAAKQAVGVAEANFEAVNKSVAKTATAATKASRKG